MLTRGASPAQQAVSEDAAPELLAAAGARALLAQVRAAIAGTGNVTDIEASPTSPNDLRANSAASWPWLATYWRAQTGSPARSRPHETQRSALSLFEGLHRSGMTPAELWIKHYAVGGDAAELEVEAYVLGLLSPDDYQHNLSAQLLNEYFLDRHEDHPVPYRDLPRRRRREASRNSRPSC